MPTVLVSPPPAPPATSPATAPEPSIARPGHLPNGGLPDGVKVNKNYDATEFFEKHQAENAPGGTVEAPPAPPATKPSSPPTPPPTQPEAPPAAPSLAERLTRKGYPTEAPAKTETTEAPAAPKDRPWDKVTLPTGASQKASESFAHVKSLAAAVQDQLEASNERERQLRLDIEALRKGAPPSDATETERLRDENKKLSDRLMLVDLQHHPKFEAEFLAPQEQAVRTAQELLDANGVKDVSVSSLLSKPRAELGKAVSEAAKNLSPFDQTEFADAVRKAYALRHDADKALSQSREVYTAMRAKTLDEQKRVFQGQWVRAAGPISENIVERDVPTNATPEQRADIEAYNADYRALQANAEKLALGASDEGAVAQAAIKAAAFDFDHKHTIPTLLKEYGALLDINRKMVAELQAMRSRNPNLGIRGTPASTPGQYAEGADPSKMGHKEAADFLYKQG